MLNSLTLDASQRAVAEAGPEDRLFVTAAAGQGKTEVLIARVLSLVADGLNPADNILVLSFSRAAVEAVKHRARRNDLNGLQIRTFDSFAAQILLDEDDFVTSAGDGFDARIRKATKHILGENRPERLAQLRHVLVDEAQDLVGDRAEMVRAIFGALDDDFGFTVLGDPLQGVYDFQLEESESQMTSSEFIDGLITDFDATPRELSGHYRATSTRTKDLIEVGNEIRALGNLDDRTSVLAHQMLDDYRLEVSSASLLHETGLLEPEDGETTAVLCSTNYEVLKVSALLWEHGYPHVVRRQARDMSVAPWVHALFVDLEDRSYAAKDIKIRLRATFGEDTDDLWLALKSAEGNYSTFDSLNVPQLSQQLRSRSIPLALTVSDASTLTVSTIHRAKGLEFTNVVYLPPPHGAPAAEISAATAKQKYVALSRARVEVASTSLPKGTLKFSSGSSGRWLERDFGKYGRYTARMEFANSDVDDSEPYVPSTGMTAAQIQYSLALGAVRGAPVSGRIEESDSDLVELPRYLLTTQDGQALGRTSQSFACALRTSFGNSKSFNWPLGFTDARVTSIETAAGHPAQTHASGLGLSGMWLVPRLTGLIRPFWK